MSADIDTTQRKPLGQILKDLGHISEAQIQEILIHQKEHGGAFGKIAIEQGFCEEDAVLHALVDAVTGAAGLDDVGTLFPDDDERWKGADSAELLRAAVELAREAGFSVVNVDVVIATEGPRIGPHRAAMRARMADLLGVSADAVNVKGKSLEGMGALAGGAGVAVQAVCLLQGS